MVTYLPDRANLNRFLHYGQRYLMITERGRHYLNLWGPWLGLVAQMPSIFDSSQDLGVLIFLRCFFGPLAINNRIYFNNFSTNQNLFASVFLKNYQLFRKTLNLSQVFRFTNPYKTIQRQQFYLIPTQNKYMRISPNKSNKLAQWAFPHSQLKLSTKQTLTSLQLDKICIRENLSYPNSCRLSSNSDANAKAKPQTSRKNNERNYRPFQSTHYSNNGSWFQSLTTSMNGSKIESYRKSEREGFDRRKVKCQSRPQSPTKNTPYKKHHRRIRSDELINPEVAKSDEKVLDSLPMTKNQSHFDYTLSQSTKNSKSESINKISQQLEQITLEHLKQKQMLINELKKSTKSYKDSSPKKEPTFSRILKYKSQYSDSDRFRYKFSQRDFKVLKQLGQGTFAKVFLAIEKKTGFLVTLKQISKTILSDSKCSDQILTEMKIQTYLSHPNIVRMYGFYTSQQHVTLILEYMEEGSLHDRLKKHTKISQKESSQKANQILYALKHLHDHQIIHRDLKPENILISNNVSKICDFGTAAICKDRRWTACGTIDYVSPEIVEGKDHDMTLDMWSFGILCYEMLTGKTPFFRISKKQTLKKIATYNNEQLKFPENLSKDAISFISKLIVKDPQERTSIKKAMKHSFIMRHLDQQTQALRSKLDF